MGTAAGKHAERAEHAGQAGMRRHQAGGYLSEELFFKQQRPSLVNPGSNCQVPNVCTLEHHLYMPCTQSASAGID